MKINNIILNGCSFVHGFDLCYEEFGIEPYTNFDLAHKNFTSEQRSIFEKQRLSGRLSELLNCNVTNLAQYGESNHWIAYSTIDYINKNNPDPLDTVVMIGWTDYVRESFFMPDGRRQFSLKNVSNYIEWNKKTNGSKSDLDLYTKMLPINDLINKNRSIINKYYYDHLSLILLLQLYLEKKSLRYIMWNSLSVWPRHNTYRHNYHDYEQLINWESWWPLGDKHSYDRAWGDKIFSSNIGKNVYTRSEHRTASGHPTILAVDEFSKKIVDFTINKFKI